MAEDQRPDPDRLLFYGRRRGRKLRPKAAQHLEKGLAAFAIDDNRLSAGEVISPQTLFDHDPGDIFLEIGFGGGEHLAARAAGGRAPPAGGRLC